MFDIFSIDIRKIKKGFQGLYKLVYWTTL